MRERKKVHYLCPEILAEYYLFLFYFYFLIYSFLGISNTFPEGLENRVTPQIMHI